MGKEDVEDREKTTEVLENLKRKKRVKRTASILIVLILLVIVGVFIVLLLTYFKSPEKQIGIGANIESALLSQDNQNVYVKLLGGSDKNITKIKFIFTDENGNENYYETSEGIQEIEVPFKRSFWDWLFRKPAFVGKYDYEISAEDVGLEDFFDINEVSVSFEYKTETGIIETPVLDTEQTTRTTTDRGPSGNGGNGGTQQPTCTAKTCADYPGQCGVLDDGCNNVLNCSNNCINEAYCYIGEGINNICINNSITCEDSDNGKNYYNKGNVSLDETNFFIDECLNNNLTEYYCYFNGTEFEIKNKSFECSEGCEDGACRIPECSEDEDCVGLNLPKIDVCNGVFWEYAPANDSICELGFCTIPIQQITRTCEISCGAWCENDEDCTCPLNGCADYDGDGYSDDYVDYSNSEFCLSDCTCSSCYPVITYNDYENCAFDWQLMNGGNPIDIGEPVDFNLVSSIYADSYLNSIVNSEGNLVYFFSSYPTGKIIGRINKEQKSWEIFTFDGWSSDSNKIARPLSESIFLINKIHTFKMPREPEKLFIVDASDIKSALNSLDVHGSIYNLIFDGQDFLYWNRTGYEKYNARALLYSWTGSSFNSYSFDINENMGILIGNQGVYGSKDTFTAAKYDVLSENWGAWNNGWVFPYENIKTTIPLKQVSSTEDFDYPIIKNIPGSNDFILTYLHEENRVYDVRAAKYDGVNEEWLVWNGEWNPNEQVPLLGGAIRSRPTIVRGNRLYMFYKNGNSINLGIYDNSESSWNFKEIISTDSTLPDFVVELDSNNKIWIVYKDEGKIKYSVESDENWEDSKIIYDDDLKILNVNFMDEIPVVFVINETNEGKRIYAISNSDSFLDNEQVRVPFVKRQPSLLNEEKIEFVDKFENYVKYEIFNGTDYCTITNSYGSGPTGHMEIDSENELYVPRVSVSNIGIFPEGYAEPSGLELSNAHNWGNFWDYFYFPSSVSVDNSRSKTFITDYISNGGGGDLGIGNLQIWDKEKKNENLMWKVLGGTCKPKVNYQTYFPKKISGFNYPSDSAIDEENGYLYVTDSLNNKIHKFDLDNFVDGKPVKLEEIGTEGDGNLQFKFPQGIDTDVEGNVYVVDTNNHRIQKFDKDGNFILSWGSLGNSFGEFIYPYSISVDKITGNVFVSDPYNFRIQIFDLQGNFLYSFGKWYEGENLVAFSEKNGFISGLVANNNTLYVSRNDEILKFNITDLTPLPDYCVDADEDGYYIGGEGCGELDCDDDNYLIHPNAKEKCDLIDWDCSGEPDNIIKTDDCPEEGEKLGACADSHRTCIGDGVWSGCSVEPVEESYQTCDLIDNNCNGEIDEECLPTLSFWQRIVEWFKDLFF